MFDVAVIGGGTVGVAISLDLISRGFSVVLIEKNRGLGLETNAKSLGLIQGGLTYLKSNRRLVKASSFDVWLLKNMFPDLLKKQEFVIPIFDWSKHSLWQWDGYLSEYDKIAETRMLPPHSILNKQEVLKKIPNLNSDAKGGAVFYEWKVEPIKFLREILLRATVQNQKTKFTIAANQKVLGFSKDSNGNIISVNCNNMHGDIFWPVRLVINAGGPWSTQIAKLAEVELMLRPTKGTSIFIQGMPFSYGLITFDKNGKYISILPLFEEQKTLIGPTNSDISQEIYDNPGKAMASAEEQEELLKVFNAISRSKYEKENIVGAQCGLRPQLCHTGVKPENISHDFAILDHQKDGVPNFCSVVGGKLSVLMRMGKETGDFVEKKFGRAPDWRLPALPNCDDKTKQLIISGYKKKFARNHWWISGFAFTSLWAKIRLIVPVIRAFLRRKKGEKQ